LEPPIARAPLALLYCDSRAGRRALALARSAVLEPRPWAARVFNVMHAV